jgi:CheY-like chemotaxis protein
VEDLLDASRIIGGKLKVDLCPVDACAAVRAAVETARPAAEAKGVIVELRSSAGPCPVRADAARLQQIVSNLLGNAINFTERGRRVHVSVRCGGARVEIEVRDEGEGIEADFLPHLFSRFTQADRTSTRRHGGLGLGLAIVRQLVELHGGEISAHSDGLGKGAAFTVRLPALSEAEALGAAAPLPAEAEAPAVPLVGIKVLAVDDEPSAREVLAEVLLSCGATVTLASGVHEALRAFKLDPPDAVVSDIAMPELDGYALVERIRALPAPAARTPVIALTAYASLQDRERALRLGFDRHLPKPIEPGPLSRAIADLVRRRAVQG